MRGYDMSEFILGFSCGVIGMGVVLYLVARSNKKKVALLIERLKQEMAEKLK
jgi:hypothetical protein